MAVFTINPANSVINFGIGPGFSGDTAASDSLIVNGGAFIGAANSPFGHGVLLANTLAWKVTVNGWIYSRDLDGINLAAGNTGVSTITVGQDGEISAQDNAIFAGSTVKITNAGEVAGRLRGIFAEQAATITNTGTIASTGPGGTAIALFGDGAHKITNSGNVTGGTHPTAGVGIGIAGTGTHTIVNSGIVSAGGFAFSDGSAGASDDKITNSGTFAGRVSLGGGTNTLSNSGTITGAIIASGPVNTITNSGTIGTNFALDAILTEAGSDTVTNSKTILGNLLLGDGADRLTNSGTINGIFRMGTGNDSVTNSGTIDGLTGGTLEMGDNDDTLTNSGKIDVAVLNLGEGNDRLTNKGTIDAAILLGNGANTVINSGTLSGNVVEIFGGVGVDTVTNTGVMFGITDLAGGNDIYNGGNNVDRVRDSADADTIKLGGGDDAYYAKGETGLDGTDFIDGGAGIDTYHASNGLGAFSTSTVTINLDNVDHDFAPMALPLIAKNTALGVEVDGGAGTKDTVLNFENVEGGDAGDIVYGSAGANVLRGNGGTDFLFGFGGNDTLIGGADADTLGGGAGKDTLDGGLGDGAVDTFVFASLADSTVGKAGRDRIVNFEEGIDRIDLSPIDGRAGTPANDSFTTYLNGDSVGVPAIAFSGDGVGGELRSIWTATGYVIEGDVNGDGKADFAIDIVDPTHAIVLTAGDFLM